MSPNPQASINAACSGWSETLAAYRFFENPSVDPEKILAPHVEATKQRIQAQPVVLVIQDTTEFDFTSHPPKDAGCLDKEYRFGFYDHTYLAVTSERVCLGVVGDEQFDRTPESLGKTKERVNWPIEDKKSFRRLLLKNPEHLDRSKGEHLRLKEALRLNQPLASAYYLKDELRLFWEPADQVDAILFLDDWCQRAHASGIRVLQKFTQTLQGHRAGLLAWCDHPISTGPLEGVNNKIKLLQRRAYGYRDLELFQLRILSLHTTRFELLG